MLAVLTACASSGVKKIDPFEPRPLPGDVKACFKDRTPAPKRGVMSPAQATEMIARMYVREEKHVRCGNRVINLYEAQ